MRVKAVVCERWRIYAACSDRGDCELLDFLEPLTGKLAKHRTNLLALLDVVSEKGPTNLPDELSHQIADNILEFIKGDLRLFWFYDNDKIIIISHGIVKKSQKTKKQDINKAISCRRRYFEHKEKNKILYIK